MWTAEALEEREAKKDAGHRTSASESQGVSQSVTSQRTGSRPPTISLINSNHCFDSCELAPLARRCFVGGRAHESGNPAHITRTANETSLAPQPHMHTHTHTRRRTTSAIRYSTPGSCHLPQHSASMEYRGGSFNGYLVLGGRRYQFTNLGGIQGLEGWLRRDPNQEPCAWCTRHPALPLSSWIKAIQVLKY